MNTDVADGQPVVVGIDGSDTALAAVQWAADYAAKSASPLLLLHAVARLDWHFLAEAPTPAVDPDNMADSVLSAAEAAVRAARPDLEVRGVTVKESVAGALQDASDGARLLVVGAGTDTGVLGRNVVRIAHRPSPIAHRPSPIGRGARCWSVAPLARKYPNAHANEIFRDISPAKGLRELSGDAQLVVVGSHGSGRIATSILGSVSQNVIHHAECSVLVVR